MPYQGFLNSPEEIESWKVLKTQILFSVLGVFFYIHNNSISFD